MVEQTSFFDDEELEDLDDGLSPELRNDLKTAIVYNLDWTVATLVSQIREGVIDLQPRYQRRDVWDIARKSKLIESLILGLPVPPIVLAEKRTDKGSFIILDGKQRLTAIAQYAGLLLESRSNAFRLAKLPLLPVLNGYSFEDLAGDGSQVNYRRALLNQPVKTAVLRGWESDEFLHVVFHRLNSQVVPLSTQELRHALIGGEFLNFLDRFSAHSNTMRWLLKINEPDFRMRDSELLLRLLFLSQYQEIYRGNLSGALDDLASHLSKNWPNVSGRVEEQMRRIEAAIELWGEILEKKNVGRKFVKGFGYESRLNRAVLDSQVSAALDASLYERARQKPELARIAFENLMVQDDNFRRSVEATTKSIDAVNYRLWRLKEVLNEAL